jgi:hypothetical protein
MTRTYTRGAPNVRPGMTFDAFIKASSMQFGGCSDCVDIARAIRRRTPGNVQGDGEDGRSFVTETCFDITGNEEHRKGDLPGTVDRPRSRLGSRHRRGYPCGSAPQLAVDQAEPCRSWRVRFEHQGHQSLPQFPLRCISLVLSWACRTPDQRTSHDTSSGTHTSS